MSALTPDPRQRQKDARARAGRIRMGIRSYIHTLGDIRAAWIEGDWKTLGYPSWDAYVAKEFGADQVKLPPEQRKKAIDELRLADMPNRAIASAINVDEKTVRRSAAAANAAVIDGEVVAPPADSPIVEAMKTAIDDATDRAQDHRAGTPGEADESSSSAAGAGAQTPAPVQNPGPVEHPPATGPEPVTASPSPAGGDGSRPFPSAPQEQERIDACRCGCPSEECGP